MKDYQQTAIVRLGRLLLRSRDGIGLSQSDVSKATGLTVKQISRYENSYSKIIDLWTILPLLYFYSITIEQLVAMLDEKENKGNKANDVDANKLFKLAYGGANEEQKAIIKSFFSAMVKIEQASKPPSD